MLVTELPLKVAEAVANLQGSKYLSLDKQVNMLGHIEMTTGVLATKLQLGNSSFNGSEISIAVIDSRPIVLSVYFFSLLNTFRQKMNWLA